MWDLILYGICAIVIGGLLVYLFSDEACDKWLDKIIEESFEDREE